MMVNNCGYIIISSLLANINWDLVFNVLHTNDNYKLQMLIHFILMFFILLIVIVGKKSRYYFTSKHPKLCLVRR